MTALYLLLASYACNNRLILSLVTIVLYLLQASYTCYKRLILVTSTRLASLFFYYTLDKKMEIWPIKRLQMLKLGPQNFLFCLTQCVNGSSLETIIKGVLEKVSRMNIIITKELQSTCCNNRKIIKLINQANHFSSSLQVHSGCTVDWH